MKGEILFMQNLRHVKLEYIQKHRKYLKKTEVLDDEGNKIPGTGRRTKGIKRGVLISGIDENGNVIVGFSLCHKLDKFDYIGGSQIEIKKDNKVVGYKNIGGQHNPGFGVNLAIQRAKKWKDRVNTVVCGKGKGYFVNQVRVEQGREALSNSVFIPASIEKKLESFLISCERYYNDKKLPRWAYDFKNALSLRDFGSGGDEVAVIQRDNHLDSKRQHDDS